MHDKCDRIHYRWRDIHYACDGIANDLQEWRPDIIMPITRGGLAPAVILSHGLNVKRLQPINIQTRDGSDGHVDLAWEAVCRTMHDTRILVVDDIVDSGKTLELMLEHNPGDNIRFASMVINTACDVVNRVPVLHEYEIDKNKTPDVWIVFPWEITT